MICTFFLSLLSESKENGVTIGSSSESNSSLLLILVDPNTIVSTLKYGTGHKFQEVITLIQGGDLQTQKNTQNKKIRAKKKLTTEFLAPKRSKKIAPLIENLLLRPLRSSCFHAVFFAKNKYNIVKTKPTY